MSRKLTAGIGLGLLGLVLILVLVSFWRENWAANQSPGAVESFLAKLLLSGSRNVEETPNPLPASEENLTEGRRLYDSYCAFCHGEHGTGVSDSGVQFYPPVPTLAPPQNQLSDAQMHYVIEHGVRYTAMPSFNKALTNDQVWKIVLWVRTLTSSQGPDDSAEPFAPGTE